MKSSFDKNDVEVLLKDISGLVEPLDTITREKFIQSGVHYSEMLPLEYKPTEIYMNEYNSSLKKYSKITAYATGVVAEMIYAKKEGSVVLVSLARAGIPIGILIKRYLEGKYCTKVYHYAISIIRGKGIDNNAMNYILEKHNPENIQFVDGWTGKGAIYSELKKEIQKFQGVDSELAVLSDPANITELCGTHEDFIIASSCLNATISGLISRTFYRKDIIGIREFHGSLYYEDLEQEDRTYEFINRIESNFDYNSYVRKNEIKNQSITGMMEVKRISEEFGVDDINFIKPGLGETTRVLLRRIPDIILISENAEIEELKHILRLAEEKNVPIIEYPLLRYKACGIIKNVNSDI